MDDVNSTTDSSSLKGMVEWINSNKCVIGLSVLGGLSVLCGYTIYDWFFRFKGREGIEYSQTSVSSHSNQGNVGCDILDMWQNGVSVVIKAGRFIKRHGGGVFTLFKYSKPGLYLLCTNHHVYKAINTLLYDRELHDSARDVQEVRHAFDIWKLLFFPNTEQTLSLDEVDILRVHFSSKGVDVGTQEWVEKQFNSNTSSCDMVMVLIQINREESVPEELPFVSELKPYDWELFNPKAIRLYHVLQDGLNMGGTVLSSPYTGHPRTGLLYHYSETFKGSSGAPVFDTSGNLIAFHRGGLDNYGRMGKPVNFAQGIGSILYDIVYFQNCCIHHFANRNDDHFTQEVCEECNYFYHLFEKHRNERLTRYY
eukprot:TRINITY_DN10608_c0_g1_i1.p1 TRINITY_DN10608_c0_g1~~TRINITY_DN10608_c0_g1_i1.p1  ORF type:complete len:367 (-),score=53.30 TRINITY_DN10608_c0_g1_i1:33-1133(-)